MCVRRVKAPSIVPDTDADRVAVLIPAVAIIEKLTRQNQKTKRWNFVDELDSVFESVPGLLEIISKLICGRNESERQRKNAGVPRERKFELRHLARACQYMDQRHNHPNITDEEFKNWSAIRDDVPNPYFDDRKKETFGVKGTNNRCLRKLKERAGIESINKGLFLREQAKYFSWTNPNNSNPAKSRKDMRHYKSDLF